MGGSLSVGDLVDGKYRVSRLIGEGGWGIVYEAENLRTLKRVALKILREQSNVTADIKTRFEREAQAAGRIGSEHIVEVYDLGTLADGSHYMVMELLAGEDLGTRLHNGGKLDAIAAAKLVVQLLEGLAAAHSAGILHRDLKPENLFLVPTRSGEEFVKILDFGISKFNTGPVTSATMTGAVLGSPCYMAPEQARGLKQIDQRTDLYSVGTVLYECVTGKVPFQGDNFNDLMFRIVLAPRPDPRDSVPDLDPAFASLVNKAISAEPGDRFATADEFKDALVAWLEANGVASVRAPEVRRAMRTPQRSGSGPFTPAELRPSMPKAAPHWSEATIPVNSVTAGEGTPIASTRTIKEPEKRRKGAVLFVVAAAAVVVVVGAGFALRRGKPTETPGGAAAINARALTEVAPAPPPPSAPPAVPTAAVAIATATTDAPVTSVTSGDAKAAGAAPSTHHGHGGHAAVVAPTKDAGVAAAEPPKPAPAPVAAPSAKPGDKVEGREIRTNL